MLKITVLLILLAVPASGKAKPTGDPPRSTEKIKIEKNHPAWMSVVKYIRVLSLEDYKPGKWWWGHYEKKPKKKP